MSKFEQLQQEYDATMKQLNNLFLKLIIWELETDVSLKEEKEEVMQLKEKVALKLKEYKNEEK
jgi:hypothetical protein